MSYTRRFEEVIDVEGTVIATYPASQNGGSMSVEYHKRVPVNINIYVDTDPFDDSILRTNYGIDGLTSSINDMSDVQVRQIGLSAKKISNTIVNGFFNYVNSQLSNDKMEAGSVLKAKIGYLLVQNENLVSKQTTMEDDVRKVRKTYSKIFNQLDDDLYRRIEELDKAEFILERKFEEVVLEPYKQMLPISYNQMTESNNINNLITSARVKSKIYDVLCTLSNSVERTIDYKNTLKKITSNIQIDENSTLYVPSLICEMERINNNGMNMKVVYTPEMPYTNDMNSKVLEYSNSLDKENWKKLNDEDQESIEKAFASYVEKHFEKYDKEGDFDDRVYNEMMKLWKLNKDKIKCL